MIKLLSKNYLLTGLTAIAVIAVVAFVVSPQPVGARDGQTTTELKSPETTQVTPTEKTETTPTQPPISEPRRLETEQKTEQVAELEAERAKLTDKRELAQTKLADVKLKVCQKREKTIDNIMTRMGDRSLKQLDVFTKIAERTEAFYVKSGKILDNYDALVAEVTATQANAQVAVTAAQSTTVTFKCDGTNPKGAADSFKTNLEARNQALKAYKTAVKNLIVGVKSVQGTITSNDVKQTEGSQQ